MTTPRPRTPSFLDSLASTSTPGCVFLSFYCSNWIDHQILDIILNLGNPKYVWIQPPLDLTKDSHTQHIEHLKNVARVFPFILKTKHKTLYVTRAWAELEILQKKKTICTTFDRSSLILDRSSQTEMHNEFCSSSIPTLHKTHTLSKSKIRLTTCFDHGLPTIQIRVLIH